MGEKDPSAPPCLLLLLDGRDGDTVPQLDAAAVPAGADAPAAVAAAVAAAAAAAAAGMPVRPPATDTVCRRSVLTGRYTTM